MNIEAGLKLWKKKIISIGELETLLRIRSDEELYIVVTDAVGKGILSPVNKSGSNGNHRYPLYLRYRIHPQEDYSEALSGINLLHPKLTKAGYLQAKPALYLQYKTQLERLSRYLFKTHSTVSVSKKERAFEIFGEEKQLEDSAFKNLLNNLGLTSEALGYYETPEYCFNDYIPSRKSRMTLLICENKDIWFNIRRRMYEDGAGVIFDVPIDGVIYGCGNRVSEAGALSEYTRFMGAEDVHYLYWGDIDRAGLNIYLSLIKNNPGLDIRLFIPAYEAMLRLAADRIMPDSDDHRGQMGDYEQIYRLFSGEVKDQLKKMISLNKRVPQEIVTYETLLSLMR